MEIFLYQLVIPMIVIILGFVAILFWLKRSIDIKFINIGRVQDQSFEEKVVDLEKKFNALKAASIPISSVYQYILIKELTHLHDHVTDDLLAKIGPPNILTEKEEIELAEALKKRSLDMSNGVSEMEREAAIILPYIIKRAKAETEDLLAGDDQITVYNMVVMPYEEQESKHIKCDDDTV